MKHLHVELHSLTQLIDFTFGLQIFLAITWLIVIITLAFHLVAKYISTLSDIHSQIKRKDFQGILAIMWAVFACVFLFIISVTCQETSEEATMSVSLVHSLLLDLCFNSDVSKDLQPFSTQLTHLKIKFSDCGFIAINLTFFYATIVVIYTYVFFLSNCMNRKSVSRFNVRNLREVQSYINRNGRDRGLLHIDQQPLVLAFCSI